MLIFFLLLPLLSLAGDPTIGTMDWKPIEIGVVNLAPLKLLNQTLDANPAQSNAQLFKIADALYFIGKYERDEECFEKAIKLTEQILATDPKNIGALLAWAASKGELAQRKNPFAALSYIRPIKEKFELIKELAPAHEGFVADRGLGRLYQMSPGFISIGSSKKAREHLKLALDGAPDHPGNQVYWADFLRSQGEFDEARIFARKTLSNPHLLTSSLERYDWVRMATEILSKIEPEIK